MQMHESVRVYFCPDCHHYHTTQKRYDDGKVTKNARQRRRGKMRERTKGRKS